MNVQIIMVLKTNALTVDSVADAVHKQVCQLVMTLNGVAPNKLDLNDILSFEAVEVRPNSNVIRFFKFPDDLDKLNPRT